MLKPSNIWPDTTISNNVLFLAQLVIELLNPETFESNRVLSLDTVSRLKECISLYKDYRAQRISKNSLNYPFEETVWSIKDDPVVAVELSKESIKTISTELSKKGNFYDAQRAAVYLYGKLSNTYKESLEQQLIDAISIDNRRNNLRVLISAYCAYLINSGYSRSYIVEITQSIFFKTDHKRISKGKVSSFFNCFPNCIKEYYCYADVWPELAVILRGVGIEVKGSDQRLSHSRKDVRSKLPIDSTHLYAFLSLEAKDSHSAAKKANENLENVRALSLLNPNALDVSWGPRFLIYKKRHRHGTVCSLPDSPVDWLSPQSNSHPQILKDISKYSKRILTEFDKSSRERILRSVSTATAARFSSSVESQLISLWSAVEGLLSEPFGETSRIEHFTHQLVPCICRRHIHRRAVYMFDQLNANYKGKFRNILRQESDFSDEFWHYRLTAVFMIDKNSDLREKLCRLASRNPLALHRMNQFYTDCKTPKALLKTMEKHEKLVSWQLSRIYRARNSLVHRTDKPEYIDSLVMNMFEYYIRALSTIVKNASAKKMEANLDQVVSGIFMDSLTANQSLSNKNAMDEELFRLVNF